MHTYHLAVCEDNGVIREEICQLCDEILTEDKIIHEITDFSSAAELQKVLDEGKDFFDLLLLNRTGMETQRERGSSKYHLYYWI